MGAVTDSLVRQNRALVELVMLAMGDGRLGDEYAAKVIAVLRGPKEAEDFRLRRGEWEGRPRNPGSVVTRKRHRHAGSAEPAVVWEAFVASGNLETAGASVGVTRERARQIIDRHYGDGLAHLVRYREQARRRLRGIVEGTTPYRLPCIVCGSTVGTFKSTVPVCRDHAHAQTMLRYHLNIDAKYDRHRALVTKQTVDDLSEPNRRFVVPGSALDAIIRDAIAHQWPILELLDPRLVESSRRGARRELDA